MRQHLVRFGVMGWIGRFDSAEARRYRAGDRVVCRTDRGLELGDVLNDHFQGESLAICGEIVRPMAAEDRLIATRLNKHRLKAIDACGRMMADRGISATLLDAEQTFDGRNLFFYFMGEVTTEIEAITAELADVYETQVQMRKFTELLVKGCGPGCGAEAAKCGTESCAGCSAKGGCARPSAS